MPVLQIENGKSRGSRFSFTPRDTVTVGREQSNRVSLSDSMVSRKHFRISHDGQRFLLEDLKSSNGTLHNGKRVERGVLDSGDSIVVGETMLSFMEDDQAFEQGECSGRTIAGYEVGERIGRGGMGTVYMARQIRLDREVAFKVLSKELAEDGAFVKQFVTEARAAGQLNHANIIQVYDVGSEDGIYFFSMEYVSVGSVADLLAKHGRLSVPLSLKIVYDTAQGLAYAENRRFIHRDIKPANLMVGEGLVTKIGDLGIAQRAVSNEPVTQKDGVSGSPHYMAPEQALGAKIDHRVDLYSLGCSWYEMLAGSTPFSGRSPQEILLKHVDQAPRPVRSLASWVPEEVGSIIERLMAKDPDNRFQHASELIDELEALRERYPLEASGEAALAPGAAMTGQPSPAGRVAVAAGVVLAIGVASFLVMSVILGWVRERNARLDKAAELEAHLRAALQAKDADTILRCTAEAAEYTDMPVAALARVAEDSLSLWTARRAAEERALIARDTAFAGFLALCNQPTPQIETLAVRLAALEALVGQDPRLADAKDRYQKLVDADSVRKEQDRLEREAAEAFAVLIRQVQSDLEPITDPDGRRRVHRARALERLADFPKRYSATSAWRAVESQRSEIVLGARGALDRIESDVRRAIERGQYARAESSLAGLDVQDHLDQPELIARIEALRTEIRERREAAERDARLAAIDHDRTVLRNAVDPALIRQWRFDDLIRNLQRATDLTTEEAIAERDFGIEHYSKLVQLREHLITSIPGHAKLRSIRYQIQSVACYPSSADLDGITFAATDLQGVELRKRYSEFGIDDLAGLLDPVIAAQDVGEELRGHWALFQINLGGDVARVRKFVGTLGLTQLSAELKRRLEGLQ